MAIRYDKLFHLMIDRHISSKDLRQQTCLSANILTRLKKNQYVSLESIESICTFLSCGVDDILDFIPAGKDEKSDGGQ